MKKSFKQFIREWLNNDHNEVNHYPSTLSAGLISPSPVDQIDTRDGLNLSIHSANGGFVVSFRRYDIKVDRNINQLYLITSDQKFEEALAQCIAMECLTR